MFNIALCIKFKKFKYVREPLIAFICDKISYVIIMIHRSEVVVSHTWEKDKAVASNLNVDALVGRDPPVW